MCNCARNLYFRKTAYLTQSLEILDTEYMEIKLINECSDKMQVIIAENNRIFDRESFSVQAICKLMPEGIEEATQEDMGRVAKMLEVKKMTKAGSLTSF